MSSIQDIKGNNNGVAHAFPRTMINALIQYEILYQKLPALRNMDVELDRLGSANTTTLALKEISFEKVSITCATSTGRQRPFFPKPLR